MYKDIMKNKENVINKFKRSNRNMYDISNGYSFVELKAKTFLFAHFNSF